MDEYSVSGGGVQAIFTAPIALPLMLVALILIIVATTKFSSGEWASGFSLFLVGGVLAYFSKILLG